MCTRPNRGYENPEGGRPLFGFEGKKRGLREQDFPCGNCPECQKNYYTDWATRGSFELLHWECSLFITATYDEEHLPPDRSLKKSDVQKLIKRIKKKFRSSSENPIRQIYCGEYGTLTLRPHYHIILFNCDFADKKKHYISPQGHQVFTSETLTRLWGKGNIEFGIAQPASIAYLFKYILKKKSRKEKLLPYNLEIDGVTYDVAHEFIESSRNPGIGAYTRDSQSLNKGYLTVQGVRKKLPKYFLEYLKKNRPEVYEKIQDRKSQFQSSLRKPSEQTLREKEFAQKKLTDTKKRL